MDQRIGPGPNNQPLQGAAPDPAYIPGITGPALPSEADEAAEVAKIPKTFAAGAGEKPESASEADPEAETAAEPVADKADKAEADAPEPDVDVDADADADADGPVDGPTFEASDRRARIVADHRGVRLRLDDQECEFRWSEIGAVEIEAPRFGRIFTVTVHTPDRRWFPIEIQAKSRSDHKKWEAELDKVLDAYFDDGEEDSKSGKAAETGTEATAEETSEKDEKDEKDASKATQDA